MTNPSAAAQAGLKLLSSRNRGLHPRGQVQSLVRIAKRATSQADWAVKLELESGGKWPADRARVTALRTKASNAMEACLWLNQEHELGYPVPAPQ